MGRLLGVSLTQLPIVAIIFLLGVKPRKNNNILITFEGNKL